ncbi:hypothetical protein P4U07_30055 [Bacillus mycoides]|uniref:hypothetical protein n=1 Tax=Bacillus mycoides TaxID=1405 RepID=UPI002E24AB4F|nr:hypothetical protein [Bacillus mycoides]
MKKITSLILAAVIVLGVISTADATQSAAKQQVKVDEIMLFSNEAGPGGGAG